MQRRRKQTELRWQRRRKQTELRWQQRARVRGEAHQSRSRCLCFAPVAVVPLRAVHASTVGSSGRATEPGRRQSASDALPFFAPATGGLPPKAPEAPRLWPRSSSTQPLSATGTSVTTPLRLRPVSAWRVGRSSVRLPRQAGAGASLAGRGARQLSESLRRLGGCCAGTATGFAG